jgi:uncharacterized protein (DUF111 family)
LKICYFDAFSGISGDMTVGALLDAGADWPALQAALASLNLGATCRLEKTKRKSIGICRISRKLFPLANSRQGRATTLSQSFAVWARPKQLRTTCRLKKCISMK